MDRGAGCTGNFDGKIPYVVVVATVAGKRKGSVAVHTAPGNFGRGERMAFLVERWPRLVGAFLELKLKNILSRFLPMHIIFFNI